MTKTATKQEHAIDPDQIRERFVAYLADTGIEMATAARGMGLSPAAVCMYHNGNYKGTNHRIARRVQAWIEQQTERRQLSMTKEGPNAFVETSVSRRLFNVARKCHTTGSIGLCVGQSGVGKTYAVLEYCRRNPDVILIEAHLRMSMRDVMHQILSSLGGDAHGTTHTMIRDIVSRIKGSGRMIIIDEAEHLHPNILDEVRRINDWTQCGILYVGLERFRSRMSGLRHDYEYIVNRVRTPIKVTALKPEDSTAIITAIYPEAKDLSDVFHRCANGNGRVLVDLLRDAIRTSDINKAPIDADMIAQVARHREV